MRHDAAHLASRLSLRHLRLLQAVARCGSLRQAADVLCMTQPAATKILRELEALFGQRLFVRTARGLVPTVFGVAATRHANVVLKDLDSFAAELCVMQTGAVGAVRIGVMASLNGALLPGAILQLRAHHPGIRLTVVEETSDRLMRLLEDGEIDISVARVPAGWPVGGYAFKPLGEESPAVLVRRGHPRWAATMLSELTDATWITQPRPTPLREVWDQLFRESRLPTPEDVMETSSTVLTVALLQQSDMIALLPRSLMRGIPGQNLIALQLQLNAILRPFGLIQRVGYTVSPAVDTVQKALQLHAREVGYYNGPARAYMKARHGDVAGLQNDLSHGGGINAHNP